MRTCSLVPTASVAAAVVPWRRDGSLAATVVAKATFAIDDDATLRLAAPVEIRKTEVYHRNNPARSIREADDLAPFKRRADVLYAGSARAPGGPVAELRVRLAVLRAGRPLMDKTLRVLGERESEQASPRSFTEMPIVFERARGGFGVPENPLGAQVPNVLSSRAGAVARPPGLAPLSWTWAARRSALAGGSRKPLEQEVAEVAAGIDDYFQAALFDQRTPFLEAGDELVLEHLVDGHAKLVTKLPRARGVAVARLPGEAAASIELVADTLFIDGDARMVSICYRGHRAMPNEEALFGALFSAALELDGAAVAWPELGTPRAAVPAAPPSQPLGLGGTVVMSEPQTAQPTVSHTVVLEEPAALAGTVVLEEPRAPLSLPFKGAGPSPERASEPHSIPGAPWASRPAAQIPTHALGSTVELSLEGVSVPSPPPPTPPHAAEPAPPAPPPPAVKPTTAKWRKDEPKEAPAAPAARAPTNASAARAPSPAVKKSLYGKFGK